MLNISVVVNVVYLFVQRLLDNIAIVTMEKSPRPVST